MTQTELNEHLTYITDLVKVTAYGEALKTVVSDGATVLDLGSGTGLLGMLACRAGAGHVYAVDSGSVLGPALETFKRNGFEDRVEGIAKPSTDLTLDSKADVVVCDQIGGFVYDAGVLTYFADAKRRLANADAAFVPAAFELFVAPCTYDKERTNLDAWANGSADFDFSAFGELAANSVVAVWDDAPRILANGECISAMASVDDSPFVGTVELVCEDGGDVDGFVGWFHAQMAPGVTLTNDPSAETRMNRWYNFYPIAERVHVEPGETVRISVDVNPSDYLMTWTVSGDGANPFLFRQSTFLGTFLTESDVRRQTGERLVPNPLHEATRQVLDLLDGSRNQDAVADHVWACHHDTFTSREKAKSYVEWLAAMVTDPAT